MELKHYLRVIRHRWKIVAGVAIATITFTVWFTSGQAPTYESSGTYVVRPLETESGEVVRATDALNRGAEINSTYTRIARSDVIKDRAKDALRADGVPTSGLRVRAEVVPRTNIIEIGATGEDPSAVAAFATAVGEQTMAYLDETGEVFQLQLLDAPEVPKNPIESKNNVTIMLGTILGLAGGAVVAFSLEYFDESADRRELSIFDDATGAYSGEFLKLRFRQEMSRCEMPATTKARWRVRSHSFTLGVMEVSRADSTNGSTPDPMPSDLRDAAQALMPHLRVEDVLAYVGDNTFAVMLPDMPVDLARRLLEQWSEHLSAPDRDGRRGLKASAHVCECSSDGLEGDEETVLYAKSLQSDAR